MNTFFRSISVLLLCVITQNSWAYMPDQGSVYGAVYTRGIILDENGDAMYVTYGDDGEETGELELPINTEELQSAQVISTEQAATIKTHYEDILEDYPNAEVLTKADYEALEMPADRPTLTSYNNYVVVRSEAQRALMVDGSQLILQESIIDPSAFFSGKSLLVSKEGTILEEASGNIGLRVSFLKNENNEPESNLGSATNYWKNNGYSLVNPLVGLPVSTGEWLTGATRTVTNEEGRYIMQYYMFCPGFSHEWTIPVNVELKYARFNPRGQEWATYYFNTYKYDYCDGSGESLAASGNLLGQMTYLNILAIRATRATPIIYRDVPIDIVVLSGAASFGDVTLATDKTKYDGSKADLTREVASGDLDGDGEDDLVQTGKFITTTDDEGEEATSFEAVALEDAPEFQAIWLSGDHDLEDLDVTETLPSYTRLLDWSDDFENRALLSEISEEDLQNTDIYLIRESDGTLITERRGIKAEEYNYKVGNAVASAENIEFNYTMKIVNRYEARNQYGYSSYTSIGGYGETRQKGFEAWQVAGNMNPEFYEKDADHLRIGEQVRIVAINRATGYMGTTRTQIKAAGDGGSVQQLSFDISKIAMEPPNLKVWAKRQSEITHGATQGESKEQTISNEGAGLSDDKMIVISTEWLDTDGSPLPAALEGYGFTGRLAKVVEDNLVVKGANYDDDNFLSHFSIKPGRQTQLVRLSEDILGEEHLYVHVSAEPLMRLSDLSTSAIYENATDDPDLLSSSGQAEGILKYRPDKFVPVKVPVFDETTNQEVLDNWELAKETDPSIEQPEAYYRWLYRPEFQVSVYDLEVAEIQRTQSDDTSSDIYAESTPVISSSDSALELLYSLTESSYAELEAYSYGDGSVNEYATDTGSTRELVFGIGGQEIRATVGDDQSVTFDNLDYLSSLESEDLLSIQLYSNNDSNNILWEWAFEYLAIDTLQDIEEQVDENGIIHVSADEPNLDLQALLFGYAERDPSRKEPITLTWKIVGDGSLSKPYEVNTTDGVFNTQLLMPTKAGSSATITAILGIGGNESKVLFGTVVVDSGQPAKISSKTSGDIGISQSHSMELSGSVTDQYGNTVADGTSVRISVDGEASQNGDYELSTENGVFQSSITGGEFSSTDNSIEIAVNDVVETIDFEVKPVQISIINTSANHYVGQESTITFQVTNSDGSPLAEADLELVTTAGLLKDEFLVTDMSGQVTAHIQNIGYPKVGELKARVGYSGFLEETYEVVNKPGQVTQSIDSKKAMIVGDQLSNGTIQHTRYDDTTIDMSFNIEATVDVIGDPNQLKTIKLGTLSYPNLMPVLSYSMNHLGEDQDRSKAPDAVGISHADIQAVETSQDNPLGAGNSYYFKPAKILSLSASPTEEELAPFAESNDVAISFDFQFDESVTEATSVINFGEVGGQTITLNPDGTLTYKVMTLSGYFEVISHELTPSEQHTVIANFRNDTISLTIDNQQVTADTEGFLIYRNPEKFIVSDNTTFQISGLQLHKQGSHLINNSVDHLKFADNTSFRVDLKLEDPFAEGELFKFYSEAVSLVINNNQQIVYQVTTDQGVYSVASEPISANEWVSIAGKYDDQLTLEVNGEVKTIFADGDIQYNDVDQLKIGHQLNAKLSSLKFFDLSSQPLVEFDDGEQTLEASIDSTGVKEVQVKSTGLLNNVAGSSLAMLSVAIIDETYTGENTPSFVNLLSSDLYTDLGGYYVDFVADNAPPISTAYLQNQLPSTQQASYNIGGHLLDAVIPPAHALDAQFFMDVGSGLWEVINWIIPFEDIGRLGQQLYFLSTGDPNYDPAELALATLGTLSIIPLPPTKALKPITATIRKLMPWIKNANPKFVVALASVLGGVAGKALKPVVKYVKETSAWRLWKAGSAGIINKFDIDAFLNIAPFIIIMADLLKDEEGREALLVLINTVSSDDDLWAWIDYLSLPTDGWSGTEPPIAEVASLQLDEASWMDHLAKNTLGLLVTDAHAAIFPRLRVSTAVIRQNLQAFTGIPARNVTYGIRKIRVGLTATNDAVFRKLVHTKQLALFSTVNGISANALRNIYRYRHQLRVSPVVIIAAIAYLESRRYCVQGVDDVGLNCEAHDARIIGGKLNALYLSAFGGVLNDRAANFGKPFSRENGNMFQVAMLALQHARFEVSQNDQDKVYDIEHPIDPPLFLTMTQAAPPMVVYRHDADIIIGGIYGDINSTVIELKSYKKTSLSAGTVRWNHSSKGKMHKQFYIDRVAKGLNRIGDFKWWFQDFYKQTKSAKGPEAKDIDNIVRKRLAKDPTPINVAALNLTRAISGPAAAKKIDLANVKTLVGDFSKRFLDGIADDVVTSYVDNLN